MNVTSNENDDMMPKIQYINSNIGTWSGRKNVTNKKKLYACLFNYETIYDYVRSFFSVKRWNANFVATPRQSKQTIEMCAQNVAEISMMTGKFASQSNEYIMLEDV